MNKLYFVGAQATAFQLGRDIQRLEEIHAAVVADRDEAEVLLDAALNERDSALFQRDKALKDLKVMTHQYDMAIEGMKVLTRKRDAILLERNEAVAALAVLHQERGRPGRVPLLGESVFTGSPLDFASRIEPRPNDNSPSFDEDSPETGPVPDDRGNPFWWDCP